MTEPTVRVVVSTLEDGREEIELSPGESMEESIDGRALLRVEALEVVSADGSGGGVMSASEARAEIEAEGTTFEQEQTGDDDREWKVELTRCGNCGEKYPADYTRCQTCGTPNKN